VNREPEEHDAIDWFDLPAIADLALADPAVADLCALALAAQNFEHVVRFATLDDASVITDYHHRCWVESFTDLLEPGVVAVMDPLAKLDRWRRWLAPESGFTTVVADAGGRPIGHATVSGHELVHLFVDPRHQGIGLGSSLLAVGEALIRVAGHRTAELHTIVGNEAAIALYKSAGWVVTDRFVHNDHDGVVYEEHVLVKNLETADP
jgi:GNAT superfamily N-acetyltransferase